MLFYRDVLISYKLRVWVYSEQIETFDICQKMSEYCFAHFGSSLPQIV